MAIISLGTTWADGQILTAAALNGNFSTIVNDYNGDITDANISGTAAILESKLLFSGSGHNHQGGTSGALITKNVTYGAFIPGTPAIGNDLGINPTVRATTTAVTIAAYARTAPTGASLTVQVYNVTQTHVVASLSITAGNNSATSSSMTNASLATNDILRFDVTAQGSSVAAANITIQITGSE